MKFQHWWRLCPSKHTIRAWCTEKQCQPLSLNQVHNLRAICINRGKYFRSHRIYKNDDLRTKMCYASFDTRSPTFWWCECVFFRKLNLIIVFCVRKHLKREQLAALAHTCIVALTHTQTQRIFRSSVITLTIDSRSECNLRFPSIEFIFIRIEFIMRMDNANFKPGAFCCRPDIALNKINKS